MSSFPEHQLNSAHPSLVVTFSALINYFSKMSKSEKHEHLNNLRIVLIEEGFLDKDELSYKDVRFAAMVEECKILVPELGERGAIHAVAPKYSDLKITLTELD